MTAQAQRGDISHRQVIDLPDRTLSFRVLNVQKKPAAPAAHLGVADA